MEKVVKAMKRLDAVTAKEFDAMIAEAITPDCDTLVIDMADTVYISSVCLRALLTGFKKMRANKGQFILRNVQKSIVEILEVTGFAGNFIIE